jgi:FtsP/CotA-like multicopper oxidase with cupredoxin domain
VITLLACAPPNEALVDERPLPALVELVDVDPDPDVVEVHLEAVVANLPMGDGPPAEAWAYRDSSAAGDPIIPGPLLRVVPGDLLRVHLHNALDVSTTLHLHGLALPSDMDGSEVSQMVIRPGDEHHHELVITHPGTFWYHPHVAVADQVARGLYGVGVSSGDIWAVHNMTDRIQPFHLHGLFFDVLETEGVSPVFDSREDVANVPRTGCSGLVSRTMSRGSGCFIPTCLIKRATG